jgi:hypothetical protein
MTLPQHADHLPRLIHNHGKEASDISSQDTHIQGIRGGDGRILPAYHEGTARLLDETDLRVDEDGRDHATYAAQPLVRNQGWQLESGEDVRTEDRAIGARID